MCVVSFSHCSFPSASTRVQCLRRSAFHRGSVLLLVAYLLNHTIRLYIYHCPGKRVVLAVVSPQKVVFSTAELKLCSRVLGHRDESFPNGDRLCSSHHGLLQPDRGRRSALYKPLPPYTRRACGSIASTYRFQHGRAESVHSDVWPPSGKRSPCRPTTRQLQVLDVGVYARSLHRCGSCWSDRLGEDHKPGGEPNRCCCHHGLLQPVA